MKKITKVIFVLSVMFFIQKQANAQYNWTVLNAGTTNNLHGLFFINPATGWIGSVGGAKIHKTTNYGNNWSVIFDGGGANNIEWIQFLNSDIGYALYYIGPTTNIIKTTNGGNNWNNVNSFGGQFADGYFADINTGYVIGVSGVYKTTNGGINFSSILSNSPISLFFYNVNTGYVNNASGGLFKTTNAGINWNLINSSVMLNGFCFTDLNTGYGGMDGIYKTTNGGINWEHSFTVAYGFYRVGFINNDTGYTCGQGGNIYKTFNAGANWSSDSSPTGQTLWQMNIASPKAIYIVGYSGTVLRKLYLNALLNKVYIPNDGRTQTHNITFNDSSCYGQIDSVRWYVNDSFVSDQHSFTYPYKQGTTFVKIKIKDNSFNLYDSATTTVTRCAWKKYTNGQILAGMSLIGDNVFYGISTGDAVYRLDINGNAVYTLSASSVLSSCSISYDSCVFFASGFDLLGFSKTGISLWPAIPLGAQITATPTVDSASNRLYIGVSNGNFIAVNKSTGTSIWNYFTDSPIKNSAVVSFDRKLVCASGKGTIYGFNLNLPSPAPPYWTFPLSDSVLVSPAVDAQGYFYFGSRGGKIYKINIPTGSPVCSIVWQTPALGSPVTSSLTIDGRGNLYFGTADGKLYSVKLSNGAVTWSFQTSGSVRSTAAITPNGTVYFGNDYGEIYGLDSNKNVKFYYIDSSKISCPLLYDNGSIYFGNEAGRLFALYDTTGGTYDYSGIYSAMWSTFQNNNRRTGNLGDGLLVRVEKVSDILPLQFALYQNYPNPFNPETIIKFDIPKQSEVKLVVYDILGRETAVLVNKKMEAGIYEFKWNTNDFSSGVYFYKMEVRKSGSADIDFVSTRKMVIIK